jgi:hypothetical protein
MKATINVTDTMLNKSIIDANKSVCELAKTLSFDYNDCASRSSHAFKATFPDGTEGKVTFYRAKTRGDKRISITMLKHHAQAGDVVTLVGDNESIKILIND